MFDAMEDEIKIKPLLKLVILFGKLRLAGLAERRLSVVDMMTAGPGFHDNRQYCVSLTRRMGTLEMEYVVMVPWKQRASRFNHLYYRS
jgi:hypothetical protein